MLNEPSPPTSEISFVPVDLDLHLELLHGWLQSEHGGPWWGLLGPIEQTRAYFEQLAIDPHGCGWVAADADGPFAYVETYLAADDALAEHYPATAGDRGLHLLVGPVERLGTTVTRRLAVAVVTGLLAEPAATRVVCEPDVRNGRMLRFCATLGATELDRFVFGDKTAALLAWSPETVAARWPQELVAARAAGRRWDALGEPR